MAERDPYEVLGLAPTASKDEVHDAYRRLAKRWHPDLNAGDEAAEWRFKEIAAAHELLSDPLARERFDRGGGTAPDSSSEPGYGHFFDGGAEIDNRMRRSMAMATSALLIIFGFGYFAESGMMTRWDDDSWLNSLGVLLLLCFSAIMLMAGTIRWILDRAERRAERARMGAP
jgi:curved DNA-binding protein CbpA